MRQLKRYTNANLLVEDLVREFVTQRGAMPWSVSSLSYRQQGDRTLGAVVSDLVGLTFE